jgi:ATP-dependent Clp protease ATP-binding subunit ClpC
MFERFTDRARRVVVLAQEEARMLNHDHIGTEHILLGLVHEGEGIAAQALESLDISLGAVRKEVQGIVGQGRAVPTGHIPFTPRAKKVLELSLREALQLRHNYIGTEHLLLGLIAEGKGVASQALQKLGADEARVRGAVVQILSDRGEAPQPQPGAESVEDESGWPGPKCPTCGSEVSVYATFRTITVPDEDQTEVRKVLFVFCRRCSNILGLFPE